MVTETTRAVSLRLQSMCVCPVCLGQVFVYVDIFACQSRTLPVCDLD